MKVINLRIPTLERYKWSGQSEIPNFPGRPLIDGAKFATIEEIHGKAQNLDCGV